MSNSNSSPTRLNSVPVTFLGVMALLMLALGWLGWLLLDQDLSLKEQHIRERVDTAAVELEEAVVRGIAAERKSLDEIASAISTSQDADLRTKIDELQSQTTFIHFFANGIMVVPETGLRYLPLPEEPQTLPLIFERADRLEFQNKDYPAAIQLLEPLAESPDAHIQAAALLRLGRINQRDRRSIEALKSYDMLAGLSNQKVGAIPASWLGLYARCSIYEANNQKAKLGVELSRLVAELTVGGRHTSTATYRYYVDAAIRWADVIGQPDAVQNLAQAHAPSEMATEFSIIWNDWLLGASTSSGIRTGGTSPGQVLGIWTTFDSDLLAGILTFDEFRSTSLSVVTDNMENRGIGWSIADTTGQILLSSGPVPIGNQPSLRSLATGGIPITVTTFETPALVPNVNDINRRRLLLTGLLLILAVILTSTYFISRSLRREVSISRLQSDFVAAVSHEFRTPLTSIRQLTELLASGRVENKEKAGAYYHILEKETARLQRLVDGLLDFGRMEAGAHRYRPELLDCGTLLDDVVTTFREEYDLTTDALSLGIKGALYVRMDKEALTRAIWNLLDNAVKYSPGMVRIEVRAQLRNDKVSISVTDQGIGIPSDEQSEIFNKFVRGSAAHLTNAKGTGMGLAMAKKIIEDQGGSISACNNPGKGSVFTIELDSAEL